MTWSFSALSCPDVSGQREGSKWGSMVAPQQKLTHGVGKHTAPADSPRISVCSFLWTFTGEKVPSTECLNSCILYPSITVLILFKEKKKKRHHPSNSHLTSSLQNVHSKTRLSVFRFLKNSLFKTLCV